MTHPYLSLISHQGPWLMALTMLLWNAVMEIQARIEIKEYYYKVSKKYNK
jgi:hypothetical protein